MSIFGKIFGKKQNASQPPTLMPPPASPPPPGAPKMMKVWDAYGRIAEIPREQWRTEVLPLNFRNAWNMPEELANLVDVTLDDGFIPDCLEPARKDWPALLAKDGDELGIYRLSDNHLLVLCAWHAQ